MSNSDCDPFLTPSPKSNKFEEKKSQKRGRKVSPTETPSPIPGKLKRYKLLRDPDMAETSDPETLMDNEEEVDDEKGDDLRTFIQKTIKSSEIRTAKLITSKLKPLAQLTAKVDKIDTQVTALTSSVNHLFKINREKNIIVYGLAEKQRETYKDRISLISDLATKLNLEDIDYDRTYRLGKSTNANRPLLIRLTRSRDKLEIMASKRNLKDSGISITDDLSPEERQERKILMAKKKEIKDTNSNAKFYIRSGKMTVTDGASTTLYNVDMKTSKAVQIRSQPFP